MSKTVFRLFANCIPVKGAKRSTICDLHRENIQLIPNELYDLLTIEKDKCLSEIKDQFNNDDSQTIEDYFDFLVANEFGFWTSTPERFPDLSMNWDYPGLISNAIIDVDIHSSHDFNNIFSQLSELGCQSVQIRYFITANQTELSDMLAELTSSRIIGVELMIKDGPALSTTDYVNLIQKYPRITNIYVHSASKDKMVLDASKHGSALSYIRHQVTSEKCCGIINPSYFSINIQTFTESRKNNSCLNRKISVDSHGQVKNCPSMSRSYGHISQTRLINVVKQESFKEPGSINKDQIEICRDCEFRYVCSDCRAYTKDDQPYGKPIKCNYDPYSAQWLFHTKAICDS